MYIPDNTPRHSVYYDYQIYPFRTPPELNGEAKRYPVVIVGAGPIGLVTALELASYGTPVVVISAEVQVSHGSRAIVFTRRSMEILQQVGIAERMLEKAYPWRSGNSIYRGQRVFRLEAPYDEDDRFQPLNNLQQQYVEQYLVEQAQQNPLIELRWGSKVIGVTSLLDHAEVQIDTPEGEYSLSCDWLIAADGAKSTIRQELGLRMEGASYSGRFVIADIKIDIPWPTERLAYFDPDWNRGNTILMHRQPEGIWRLDYQLPPNETPEQALAPESLHTRIQAQLDMVGISAPWELDWCSVYSARAMTLPDYVHERIIFTGDAAHMLPIFGVRGANTGFQDAQNLAWKLAMLLKGVGTPELLATYSSERVIAAREIIAEASKSTRFMTPPDRGYRLLRDAVLSLSLTQAFVRPLFHWRTSRPHDYHETPLNALNDDNGQFTAGSAQGMPLQNIRLAANDYLFDHLGAAFHLLYFTNQTVPESLLQQVAELEQQGIPLKILTIGKGQALADSDGHFAKRYDAQTGTAYLIRPDQHVCARWKNLTAEQLKAAIYRALGQGAK
ncbi:FAD-dependent monooxygenase [uncultured Thiothrix sp.]|uniref:FAD-dependent monooxygenase n=1 Tax=uncultured Thiothrix sp. TaxID=223185 RepID=UPI002638968E|nr:FAD-dependent monooxygenase [uncultured Thiothrix sp.]